MPPDIRMGHPTNRGVALYGEKVYMATSTRRSSRSTRARDASFGTEAVEDYNGGYYMTLAPLAAGG